MITSDDKGLKHNKNAFEKIAKAIEKLNKKVNTEYTKTIDLDDFINKDGTQNNPIFSDDDFISYNTYLKFAKKIYPIEQDKYRFYFSELWNQSKTPKTFESCKNILNQMIYQNFSKQRIEYAMELPFKAMIEKNIILAGETQTKKTTKLLSIAMNYVGRFDKRVLIIKFDDMQNLEFWKDSNGIKYHLLEKYDLICIDDMFNESFTSDFEGKECRKHFKNFIRYHHERDSTRFLITMNDDKPDIKFKSILGESTEGRLINGGENANIYIYTKESIKEYKYDKKVLTDKKLF